MINLIERLFILHFTLKSGDHYVETGIVYVKQKKAIQKANFTLLYQNKII